MTSKIAAQIALKSAPVAVVFTDEKPDGALQFKEGVWACVVTMLIAASEGKTAVFDRKTTGCRGGLVGLCFGHAWDQVPGGIETFLSKEERLKKSVELARESVAKFPVYNIPQTYVVFKPLSQVREDEKPVVVVFVCNCDQVAALVGLANYGRGSNDNVIAPFGAGCHTIVSLPYHESFSDRPRAVIGLTDVTVRRHLERDVLSFALPWAMYEEMEANVESSFLKLKSGPWEKVKGR